MNNFVKSEMYGGRVAALYGEPTRTVSFCAGDVVYLYPKVETVPFKYVNLTFSDGNTPVTINGQDTLVTVPHIPFQRPNASFHTIERTSALALLDDATETYRDVTHNVCAFRLNTLILPPVALARWKLLGAVYDNATTIKLFLRKYAK
jgi:hypothetical protein